jgi:hypothetical protein
MISDWGRTQPWTPKDWELIPTSPTYIPPHISQDDINKIKKFLDLLEQVKIFDEATKQPECTDDRKDKFEKALKDLIKKYYEAPSAS